MRLSGVHAAARHTAQAGLLSFRKPLQRRLPCHPCTANSGRRVPDIPETAAQPSATPTSTPMPSSQGTGLVTYMPQAAQAAPTAGVAVQPAVPHQGAIVPAAAMPQQAMVPAVPQRQPIRWSQVSTAIGLTDSMYQHVQDTCICNGLLDGSVWTLATLVAIEHSLICVLF